MRRAPRHWARYQYYDPYVVLPSLQKLRIEVGASDLPDNVKNLRTRSLQKEREYWDATVLCYLMSEASGLRISLCREQESDYDTIFAWQDEGSQCFAPVQLKELVPAELNPTASLEQVLVGLEKYADSSDLVVGVKLNRRIQINLDTLSVPELPVAEVWLFGATEESEQRWSLFGQDRGEWRRWDIALPSTS